MSFKIIQRIALVSLIVLTALPSHGRFISEDKWEGQQDTAPSLHKYLYTYQNPTVYVDPDGNAPVLAEMANGLMSQVNYINNRATAYRKQGGLSGHFTATMMNVGAGVHAILGGAVGLVNTVADVGISGSASRLESVGVEFNEYGVVADSRAHLSDVGTSLKKAGNTAINIGDRNVRAELGRGGVETVMGAINGDPDALNKAATTFTTFGVGGAVSKLNPVRSFNNSSSSYGPNISLVTENPSGITPRVHSNGQANSAQYAKLKDYYTSGDPNFNGSGPVPGVIAVNPNVKSTKALQNHVPKNNSGIEFVFDPNTKTFATGKPKKPNASGLTGSPHQQLASSINADTKTVVGGTLTRGKNGEFNTTENSGHYGQNWTPEVRKEYQDSLESSTGKKVDHEVWE